MANNIKISKSGSFSIVVEFGSNYTGLDRIDDKKKSFDSRDIVEVQLAKDDSSVTIMMRDAHGKRKWNVTADQTHAEGQYFIIDEVAGDTTIADNGELFDLITALRG